MPIEIPIQNRGESVRDYFNRIIEDSKTRYNVEAIMQYSHYHRINLRKTNIPYVKILGWANANIPKGDFILIGLNVAYFTREEDAMICKLALV